MPLSSTLSTFHLSTFPEEGGGPRDTGQTSRTEISIKNGHTDAPSGPVVKNLSANAEDTGSIPSLGRFHRPWGITSETHMPRAHEPQEKSLQ